MHKIAGIECRTIGRRYTRYIRWKLAFADVIRLKPLETGMAKIAMANVLLMGAAKNAFGSTLVRAAVPHPEDSPAADKHLSRKICHFSKFVLRRSVNYVVLHMN